MTASYVCPSLRDLAEIPFANEAFTRAIASLAPRELGVWARLNWHLYNFGTLPVSYSRLAQVGGVTPAAFKRMVPALAPLFDHDEEGRWLDHRLVAKRNSSLGVVAGESISFEAIDADREDRSVDADISDKRSKAGRKGAAKRWADRLQLLPNGKDVDSKVAISDMANSHVENGKSDAKDDGKLASDLSSPPRADGLTDFLVSKEKASVSPSDVRAGRVGAPEPNGNRDSKPDGKTPGAADGKNGGTDDGKGPSRDKIVEVVRRAVAEGGGELDAGWATPKCVDIITAAHAERCDLERHFAPALEEFAKRAKEKIRFPSNDAVMRAAWENHRRDIKAPPPPKPDFSRLPAPARTFHEALETNLGAAAYSAWGPRIVFRGVNSGIATLEVPSKFLRHHLQTHFENELVAAARGVQADATSLVFEIRPADALPPHGGAPP